MTEEELEKEARHWLAVGRGAVDAGLEFGGLFIFILPDDTRQIMPVPPYMIGSEGGKDLLEEIARKLVEKGSAQAVFFVGDMWMAEVHDGVELEEGITIEEAEQRGLVDTSEVLYCRAEHVSGLCLAYRQKHTGKNETFHFEAVERVPRPMNYTGRFTGWFPMTQYMEKASA